MARPVKVDRSTTKEIRMVCRAPRSLDARVRAAAKKSAIFAGNTSQLIRVAVEKYVAELEAIDQTAVQENL